MQIKTFSLNLIKLLHFRDATHVRNVDDGVFWLCMCLQLHCLKAARNQESKTSTKKILQCLFFSKCYGGSTGGVPSMFPGSCSWILYGIGTGCLCSSNSKRRKVAGLFQCSFNSKKQPLLRYQCQESKCAILRRYCRYNGKIDMLHFRIASCYKTGKSPKL